MNTLEQYVRAIGNWGTVLGAVFLLAVGGLITATVVGRACHIALPGTFDLVETMMVVVGSFAIVFCQMTDNHLRADIAIGHIKGRLRHAIESFNGVLSIFYWAIILVASTLVMQRKWEVGEETDLLTIPVAPFRGVLVAGLILMVVLLLFNLVYHVKALIRGGREN